MGPAVFDVMDNSRSEISFVLVSPGENILDLLSRAVDASISRVGADVSLRTDDYGWRWLSAAMTENQLDRGVPIYCDENGERLRVFRGCPVEVS